MFPRYLTIAPIVPSLTTTTDLARDEPNAYREDHSLALQTTTPFNDVETPCQADPPIHPNASTLSQSAQLTIHACVNPPRLSFRQRQPLNVPSGFVLQARGYPSQRLQDLAEPSSNPPQPLADNPSPRYRPIIETFVQDIDSEDRAPEANETVSMQEHLPAAPKVQKIPVPSENFPNVLEEGLHASPHRFRCHRIHPYRLQVPARSRLVPGTRFRLRVTSGRFPATLACYIAVQDFPDKPGTIDTSIKDSQARSTYQSYLDFT